MISTDSEAIRISSQTISVLGNIFSIFKTTIFIVVIFLVWTILKSKESINKESQEKINRLKRNGKYIKSLFVEVNETKENLRYFYNKGWKKRIRKNFIMLFDNYYKRKLVEIYNKRKNLFDVKNIKKLEEIKKKVNEQILVFEDIYKGKECVYEKFDKAKHFFSSKSYFYKEALNDINDKINFIENKCIILLGKAGGGKTNLVCNIAETLLRKNKVIFFEAKDVEEDIEQYVFKQMGIPEKLCKNEKIQILLDYFLYRGITKKYIIIDGLNENRNEKFFINLVKIINKIEKSKSAKILLTCRTEYFEKRYKEKFEEKATKIPYIYNISSVRMNSYAKKRLLENYRKEFCFSGNISLYVQEKLLDNLILMRMFFEVNKNMKKNVTDLEITFLFEKYIESVAKEKSGELDSVLNKIAEKMLETNNFIDVDINYLTKTEKDVLEKIEENLIISNKIKENEGTLNLSYKETLYFIYDEFRDYIIAKNIVKKAKRSNAENEEKFVCDIIKKIDNKKMACEEGVLKYLYIEYKKEKNEKISKKIFEKYIVQIENYKYSNKFGNELSFPERIIFMSENLFQYEKDYLFEVIKYSDNNNIRKITCELINGEIAKKEKNLQILIDSIELESDENVKMGILLGFSSLFKNEKEMNVCKEKIERYNEEGRKRFEKVVNILEKYKKTKKGKENIEKISEKKNNNINLTIAEKYCIYNKPFYKTKKSFINFFGVKSNSLAGIVFERIYSFYFDENIKIQKFYNKYYCNEFDNSIEMMYHKFLLSMDKAKKFSENNFSLVLFNYKMDDITYYIEEDTEFMLKFSEYIGGIEYEGEKWICH